MIRKKITISVLALVFVLGTRATAQMYQYTDKNGNVVFTDTPPGDICGTLGTFAGRCVRDGLI